MTAETHMGYVRTNNEDNFITNADLSQSDWFVPQDTSQLIQLGCEGCVMVVADGMGGLNAGEVASAIAVETVKKHFQSAELSSIAKSQKSTEIFMRKMVIDADREIKNHVKEHPETKGMGTTIVIAWIHNDIAHIVWCGDSRAYVFKPSKELIRLTKDHSYVQELIDAGKLNEDVAIDHPDSNIITRCLGDFTGKANPDYNAYRLNSGDFILLCTDGLCGICRDEEILQVLESTKNDLELCKKQLILCALKAGGYDNVTIAIMEANTVESDTNITSCTFFEEKDIRRIKLSENNRTGVDEKGITELNLKEYDLLESKNKVKSVKVTQVGEVQSSKGFSNKLIIILLLIILILMTIIFFRN